MLFFYFLWTVICQERFVSTRIVGLVFNQKNVLVNVKNNNGTKAIKTSGDWTRNNFSVFQTSVLTSISSNGKEQQKMPTEVIWYKVRIMLLLFNITYFWFLMYHSNMDHSN